jgi:hypothetical protein
MSTTEVVAERVDDPGPIRRALAHFRPKPLQIVRHDQDPDRRRHFVALLVQTQSGGTKWVQIHYPLVYLKASSFRDKFRFVGQLLYKTMVGAVLQQIGYGFFSFVFYMLTQNPLTAGPYDNPNIIGYGILHLLHIHTAAAVPAMSGMYQLYKHFVLRDAMEYAFRGAFFWIGFTNAGSIKRQVDKHSMWARLFAWTRVIPTEVQPGWTKWWQLPFVPVAMYLLPIPAMSACFFAIIALTRNNPALQHTLLENGAKWAGFLGAITGTRYVVDKISVDFHNVTVDGFRDRGWRLHWPTPAAIRALANSPFARPVPGNQGWMVFGLLAITAFLFGGWYVGVWILNNVPWLAGHTLFSQEGWQRLSHGIGITKWWL